MVFKVVFELTINIIIFGKIKAILSIKYSFLYTKSFINHNFFIKKYIFIYKKNIIILILDKKIIFLFNV